MSEYTEQADKFLKDTGTKFKAVYLENALYFQDDKDSRDIWKITLRRNGKSMAFKFGQSIDASRTNEEPTVYDVLTCLTKYEPGTFDNFCAEYGYDTDSRKAEKIYKAVVKEWKGVNRLFSDVIEQLAEIQ